MIELLPSWAVLLLTIFFILLPIQVGYRLGRFATQQESYNDAPIGSVVGAALGLLAFMLAFTFQIATNRLDSRKQLLLDEVSSLRETYLRASLLPEPQRSESQALVRQYVDLRVASSPLRGVKHLATTESQEIHAKLWAQVESLAALDRSSEVYALFTSSVSDVITLHYKRMTVLVHYKIPSVILWVLYCIAFLSMLILALDRPEEGFLKVNQQPMNALQMQIHKN
ncbi:MAG: hypothetical protein ABI616_05735 [Pseudomonadota bacterium]